MNTKCSLCSNRSACFDELSINELAKVTDNKAEIVYKKGETLMKQNGAASHIYFIKSGLVKVHVENQNKSLIIELANKGSMLGISSLNHSNRYNFSVTAVNDVEVCEINIEIIQNIMTNNVGFSTVIINDLNNTIDKLLSRIYCLSQKNMQSRVAEMLVFMSVKIFGKNKFVMPLSRNELGELTSMATENVVRMLKDFHKKSIINLSGKKVEILDLNALKKLSS